jgi:hypothetical protein
LCYTGQHEPLWVGLDYGEEVVNWSVKNLKPRQSYLRQWQIKWEEMIKEKKRKRVSTWSCPEDKFVV